MGKSVSTSKTSTSLNGAWVGKPDGDGAWTTPANWKPDAVPPGKARFGASPRTTTDVSFPEGSEATVQAIAFTPSSRPYTFTFTAPAPEAPALTVTGEGIVNKSANTQTFRVASSAVGRQDAQLKFTNSATAGGLGTAYHVGPSTPGSAGGGVIAFCDESTAGSASFTVTTGKQAPPRHSTVGGEVSFSDDASADRARFMVYGSTGKDGDTFGNAVFHDRATAANAEFTNAGGTLNGGDGGNTQFYGTATAASAVFQNYGATAKGANGGDVAFDGTSDAGTGSYHNYPATAAGGNGGVTSFNNNPPNMGRNQGASASRGVFHNYGARADGQGGGHTFFNANHGSPTADHATVYNYGSAVPGSASSAGHTELSITVPQRDGAYYPTAADATFWNLPGLADNAPGGSTVFAVWTNPPKGSKKKVLPRSYRVPTAANATFINLGGAVQGARGGSTVFRGTSTAESAVVVAAGGANGGEGGRVEFRDSSRGGKELTIRLSGNGVVDLSGHLYAFLWVGDLAATGGHIETVLALSTPWLRLHGELAIDGAPVQFRFSAARQFSVDRTYTLLKAPNLRDFSVDHFEGNEVKGRWPRFSIERDKLRVTFGRDR